jgi:hypothetical protein
MSDRVETDDAVITDYEYDSHYSAGEEEDITDTESDILEFASSYVNTTVDVGRAITASYNNNNNNNAYDVSDQHDIFDDGLEGDDSEDDSDTSSNYEELTVPAVVLLEIVEAPLEDDLSEDNDGTDSGDAYVCSEVDEEPAIWQPGGAQLTASVPNLKSKVLDTDKDAPRERHALDVLTSVDLAQKNIEKLRDRRQWKLMELRESMRRIELEIDEEEEQLQIFESDVINGQANILVDLVGSGLSYDLFECYKEFRDSLHPKYGLRDGFSITCNYPHNGSYLQYDPQLDIFQACVEMDHNICNFRSEASVMPADQRHPLGGQDNIVEFWPIQSPELLTGLEKTGTIIMATLS